MVSDDDWDVARGRRAGTQLVRQTGTLEAERCVHLVRQRHLSSYVGHTEEQLDRFRSSGPPYRHKIIDDFRPISKLHTESSQVGESVVVRMNLLTAFARNFTHVCVACTSSFDPRCEPFINSA